MWKDLYIFFNFYTYPSEQNWAKTAPKYYLKKIWSFFIFFFLADHNIF